MKKYITFFRAVRTFFRRCVHIFTFIMAKHKYRKNTKQFQLQKVVFSWHSRGNTLPVRSSVHMYVCLCRVMRQHFTIHLTEWETSLLVGADAIFVLYNNNTTTVAEHNIRTSTRTARTSWPAVEYRWFWVISGFINWSLTSRGATCNSTTTHKAWGGAGGGLSARHLAGSVTCWSRYETRYNRLCFGKRVRTCSDYIIITTHTWIDPYT